MCINFVSCSQVPNSKCNDASHVATILSTIRDKHHGNQERFYSSLEKIIKDYIMYVRENYNLPHSYPLKDLAQKAAVKGYMEGVSKYRKTRFINVVAVAVGA